VTGLAADHAKDVQMVAQAAKRTGAKPSKLGRQEYSHNMENITRAYPLRVAEYER
jgi:predicted dinucleotide-binding enzyme